MNRIRMRRRMQHQTEEFPIIALTSLLDIALTLLVMLIVAAPNIHNGLRVSLPHGKVQEARNTQQEHVLTVSRDGALFWNKKKITREELKQVVQKDMLTSKNKIVFVHGDANASYGEVIKTVLDLREMNQKAQGGIEHVVFVTTPLA